MAKTKHPKRIRRTTPTDSKLQTFLMVWGIIGTLTTILMAIYTLVIQQPINDEFAKLKHDYPMIQDLAESEQIAKAII